MAGHARRTPRRAKATALMKSLRQRLRNRTLQISGNQTKTNTMKLSSLVVLGLTLLFAARFNLSAQPVMTSPPASLAVPLGTNAVFRVTATGTPPLTYQWRLDGGDLSGATNASLLVSNVTLADLGSYTVVVGNASGQTVSPSAWLKLARWNEMVVFGDSYSLAQFSNGKAWVDWLGQFLCLSAPGQIKNYAVGGAGTAGVHSQINQYLSANRPGTNTLLVTTWAGISGDLGFTHVPVPQVVSNYATNITLLAQAGGRAFILPTIPPLYLVPAWSGDEYLKALDYPDLNARLDREIQKVTVNFAGLTVFRPDWSNQVARLAANPVACGFTNVTGAAKACTSCDPNRYFSWDGLHPTTVAHRWFAQQTYPYLTLPLTVAMPTPAATARSRCSGKAAVRLSGCSIAKTWSAGFGNRRQAPSARMPR